MVRMVCTISSATWSSMSRDAISMNLSMKTSTKLHMQGTTSWSCGTIEVDGRHQTQKDRK